MILATPKLLRRMILRTTGDPGATPLKPARNSSSPFRQAIGEKCVSGPLLSLKKKGLPAFVEKRRTENMYLLQPSAIAYKFLAFGRVSQAVHLPRAAPI